jgi:hypothetical protein
VFSREARSTEMENRMIDYTRKNLTEAAQTMLAATTCEKRVSAKMLESGMNLPTLCKFAATDAFVWGDPASGPLLSATVLVRKALRALDRNGEFGFDEQTPPLDD